MASSSAPPTCGWEIETRHGVVLFTDAEPAAANHLVQLSSGSGGGDDDGASPSSSSSSVNTAAAASAFPAAGDEELDRRAARKRYRLLSELYAAATRPPAYGVATVSGARKRKRRDGKAASYEDRSC